jgi:hypothetical protein
MRGPMRVPMPMPMNRTFQPGLQRVFKLRGASDPRFRSSPSIRDGCGTFDRSEDRFEKRFRFRRVDRVEDRVENRLRLGDFSPR